MPSQTSKEDMSNYLSTTPQVANATASDQPSVPVPIAVITVLCFISVLSILGNSLVCIAIYKQPQLRTVMHLPMLSLAIADLLCGSVAMPAYIVKKFVDGRSGEWIVCDVFRFTYFFIEYASVSSLVVVSIERMMTLKYPLKIVHPKFARKIIALLLLAWFDACLVSLLPFVPWNSNSRGSCSYRPTKWWSLMVIHKNVFIPFITVIICYSYIYKIAMSHVTAIHKDNRVSSANRAALSEWKQRRKATMTLFIVVGVFLLCWLPSSIYYYVKNVCDRCFDSLKGETELIFNAVVKILTFANSMTNPFIYWWRSREFRKAFRRIFGRRGFGLGQRCSIYPRDRSSGQTAVTLSHAWERHEMSHH